MKPDWNRIKIEYISGSISYSRLAEKYGLNTTTLATRAKREGWYQLREEYRQQELSESLKAAKDQTAKRAERLQGAADILLDRIELLAAETEDAKDIRALAAALKDIREVQMIRSEADLREQEARIANLERQASKGAAEPIEVIFTKAPEAQTEEEPC